MQWTLPGDGTVKLVSRMLDKEEQEFGEHGYRMVLEAGSYSGVQFQILREA